MRHPLQWLDDPQEAPSDPQSPSVWLLPASRCSDRGHSALAIILARQLNADPALIHFQTDALGRRTLPQDVLDASPLAHRLDFTLSHCPAVTAIGICRDGRIGVDVESTLPEHWDQLAPDVLTDLELASLAGHLPADRPQAFLRLWTAKEAIAKALGLGLQAEFRGIELHKHQGNLAIQRVQHSTALAAPWHLESRSVSTPSGNATIAIALAHAARPQPWTTKRSRSQ